MKPGSSEWLAWVYSEASKRWPEINRSSFCFDDPWLLYDHLVDDVCRVSAQSGDLVMDVGANRGIVSLMYALKGANVVAYEPSPIAFEILEDTIRRNGIEKQVCAINAAVSTRSGKVDFSYGGLEKGRESAKVVNGRMSSIPPADYEFKKEVEAISFEDAVGTQSWDHVKIDIEGFEFDLLLSCSDSVFKYIKNLDLELHFDDVTQTTYEQLISRLDTHFVLDGVKNGEDRYQALFARAR